MATTAELLDSLGAALEAVAPAKPLAADDSFAVFIGERPRDISFGAQRTVHVAAYAGMRRNNTAWCDEWETTVTIENAMPLDAGNAEPGGEHWSSLQLVIADAESLLEAAYDWAAATAGVDIDPQPAPVQDTQDGALVCVRVLTLRYQRT